MNKTGERTIFILRHAHRDKEHGPAFDNGLSTKGKLQASTAARVLAKKLRGLHPHLISSPKKRCVETLQPLARLLKCEVAIDNLLLEQDSREGSTSLEHRVVKFLNHWKKASLTVTIICSHGDWIPIATRGILGKPIDLKKSGWVEIRIGDGKVNLQELVQNVLAEQSSQSDPS